MKITTPTYAPIFEGQDLNGKPFRIWLSKVNPRSTWYQKIFIQYGRQKSADLLSHNKASQADKVYLTGLYRGGYSDVEITLSTFRQIYQLLEAQATAVPLLGDIRHQLASIDHWEGKYSETEWDAIMATRMATLHEGFPK